MTCPARSPSPASARPNPVFPPASLTSTSTCPGSWGRAARAERAGLVRRARSDADGRLSYVTLTPAGHALVERSVDGLLRHEEALLCCPPSPASSGASCLS